MRANRRVDEWSASLQVTVGLVTVAVTFGLLVAWGALNTFYPQIGDNVPKPLIVFNMIAMFGGIWWLVRGLFRLPSDLANGRRRKQVTTLTFERAELEALEAAFQRLPGLVQGTPAASRFREAQLAAWQVRAKLDSMPADDGTIIYEQSIGQWTTWADAISRYRQIASDDGPALVAAHQRMAAQISPVDRKAAQRANRNDRIDADGKISCLACGHRGSADRANCKSCHHPLFADRIEQHQAPPPPSPPPPSARR